MQVEKCVEMLNIWRISHIEIFIEIIPFEIPVMIYFIILPTKIHFVVKLFFDKIRT